MDLWLLMALDDNADLIIRELLQNAKFLNDSARRSHVEKRLDIYKDDWLTHLKNELDRQFSEKTREAIKQMIDDSVNIPKRIVNDISLVYQREAKRQYIKNDKEDENYKEVISQIPTDLIMEQVNRFTNLVNETLVYVVPRGDKIEYDILTPDQVEVFQNEEDPTKADAILFCKTSVDTIESTAIEKIYWDVFGNHKILDENDQVIEDKENPYIDPNNKDRTILPFVIFHKNYPKDSIWDRTSGNDLFSAAIQVGVLLTYLNYSLKTNSFKQTWGTGIAKKDAPASIVFDQLHPLFNPNADGKFGTLDHTVGFEEFMGAVVNKIALIANNWGLSLDNFKLTVSAQSGFALRIKNFGLEKIVIEQKKHYRYGEKKLFEVTKIVNNTAFKNNKIADDGLFSVDFAELIYPSNPEETRKQWSFDIKVGARNIWQYMMETNPDIKTNDQAEKVFLDNIKINKEAQTKGDINLDQIFDTLLKVSGGNGGGSPDGGGESSPLI